MLQRGPTNKPIHEHGFIIAIELEEDSPNTYEQLAVRLADACVYMDGVGKVDVNYMGKFEDQQDDANNDET